LAKKGAARLLLTSRRGLDSAGAAEVVAELTALGVDVEVAACDVADRANLAKLLDSIPAEAPLRGVIHCAGILDDGAVDEQTTEQLARAMAPKVWGAWHLHQLTRERPLELFVLYSSASAVVGLPGNSNYAAANVFLDQLAHHRRAQGLPAHSLSWGVWSGGGLASSSSNRAELDRMRRQGFDVLSPERGIALLEAALGRGRTHQVPWVLQLRRLAKSLGAGGEVPAFWRHLIRPPRGRRGSLADGLVERLALMATAERREHVIAMVREDAAHVLGVRSPGDLAMGQPFRELGVDSLMAVELRNRLAERFGVKLPATLVFDYPTLQQLSTWLLDQLFPSNGDRRLSDGQFIALVARAVAVSSVAQLDELGLLHGLNQLAKRSGRTNGDEVEKKGLAAAAGRATADTRTLDDAMDHLAKVMGAIEK
jgi:acyl carrier protein/NADP-dependent 3-hydroxy acid dehydrogenase YdfG